MKVGKLLESLGACSDAIKLYGDKSVEEAWNTCDRGDWMLWLCGMMADKSGWPTRQQVVLAACECVAQALIFIPKGENRPSNAIKISRAWAIGNATMQEVRAPADDAFRAATFAACTSQAVAAAAEAATLTFHGVAASADIAAAAKKRSLRCSANICRKLLPMPNQQ